MIPIFSHYVPGRVMFLAALEAVVLLLAAYVGISLHFTDPVAGVSGALTAAPTQALLFAVCMLIVMSSMGLYQTEQHSVGVRLVAAFLLGFLVTGMVSSVVPALYLEAHQIAGVVVLALAGSALVRAVFHKWSTLGVFKSRVLVLGTGSRVMRLAEFAQRNHNHVIVGYVSLQQTARHYIPLPHVLAMEPGESLLSVAQKHGIDEIVIAVRDRRGGGFPVQQLLECRLKGVKVTELATFFEREHRQMLLESLNPSWMVLGDGFRQGLMRRVVKRAFDLAASLALLVVAAPIMLLTAVCISLESGLPILYRQARVGEGGRTFTLYKFRSMKNDAEGDGTPRWAATDDDRATCVGRIIRKLRIDELPQIVNVLKGDMSFVGPRPERPYFVDQLSGQIPYYALRHAVKPGITGWAQVRYPYGASVDDSVEKLQYDLYYVKNHGLFLDLMILIDTVQVVLWGKGAR